MTSKERIDAVLNHKLPDRTPFALVDGGAWIARHENMSYRTLYGLEDGGAILSGKPEEVYAEACERIRAAAGRGFILAPGCDLGADAPVENVKMMVKACKDVALA